MNKCPPNKPVYIVDKCYVKCGPGKSRSKETRRCRNDDNGVSDVLLKKPAKKDMSVKPNKDVFYDAKGIIPDKDVFYNAKGVVAGNIFWDDKNTWQFTLTYKDVEFIKKWNKIVKNNISKQRADIISKSDMNTMHDEITQEEFEVIKALARLYHSTYKEKATCMYDVVESTCVNRASNTQVDKYRTNLTHNIGWNLLTPIELIEYQKLCDSKCDLVRVDWSVKMREYKVDDKKFKFPMYDVVDPGMIFDNYSFYRRSENLYDYSKFELLFRAFPSYCKILPKVYISHYIDDDGKFESSVGSKIGEKYGDNTYVATKNGRDDIEKTAEKIAKLIAKGECMDEFVLIPISLNFKYKDTYSAHAATAVLDINERMLELYDPHGGIIYKNDGTISNRIIEVDEPLLTRFGKILTDILWYKRDIDIETKSLSDTCDRRGIQDIENVFDSMAKKYYGRTRIFKNVQNKKGNCVMWNYLYITARLSNPTLDSKEATSLLRDWIKQKDVRTFILFEKMYQILKIGKKQPGHIDY